MNEYEKNLEKLFTADSDLIFSNGMIDHAIAIFVQFFNRAEKEVNIFCSNLLNEAFCSNRMTKAIQYAFNRGVKINILVQSKAEAVDFIEQATHLNKQLGEERISIWQNNDPEIESIDANYAVMDKKAFRLEPEKSEHKALACANNEKVAGDLYALIKRTLETAKSSQAINLTAI